MLVATLVNLVLLVLFFVLGFVILGLLLSHFPAIEGAAPMLMLAIFALSIIGSFLIYSRLVKWATEKFDLENKLDPLFTSKKNRRRKED